MCVFLTQKAICRWATCHPLRSYLRVDLDQDSLASAGLFLHLSNLTKITILSRNSPKLNMRKYVKVALVFSHSEACRQEWLSPVEIRVQIPPHPTLSDHRVRLLFLLCAQSQQCKYWGPCAWTSVIWAHTHNLPLLVDPDSFSLRVKGLVRRTTVTV